MSLDAEIDQILTKLENDVSRDVYKRFTQHISGKSPKQSHFEAKAAIKALVGRGVAKPNIYADTVSQTISDNVNVKVLRELQDSQVLSASEQPLPQEEVGGKQVDTLSPEQRTIYRRGYRAGWEAGTNKAYPKGVNNRAEVKAKQEAWAKKWRQQNG